MNPLLSLARRRQLRKEGTDVEILIWRLLRARQFITFKFRRQHPFGPYILDFYCPARRLAIELDGDTHYEPTAQDHDRRRTEYLCRRGITVLRFNNHQVRSQTNDVLEAICRALT